MMKAKIQMVGLIVIHAMTVSMKLKKQWEEYLGWMTALQKSLKAKIRYWKEYGLLMGRMHISGISSVILFDLVMTAGDGSDLWR